MATSTLIKFRKKEYAGNAAAALDSSNNKGYIVFDTVKGGLYVDGKNFGSTMFGYESVTASGNVSATDSVIEAVKKVEQKADAAATAGVTSLGGAVGAISISGASENYGDVSFTMDSSTLKGFAKIPESLKNPNAVTFASTGGASAGTSYDGLTAVTVDYGTVGALKQDASITLGGIVESSTVTFNNGAVTISTTIGNGKITNAMLENKKVTIAEKDVSLGGSLSAADLSAGLGLGSAAFEASTAFEAKFNDGSATVGNLDGTVLSIYGVNQSGGAISANTTADTSLNFITAPTISNKIATESDVSTMIDRISGSGIAVSDTGVITITTQPAGDNTTNAATTAFVTTAIQNALDSEVTFKGVTSTLPDSPKNGDLWKCSGSFNVSDSSSGTGTGFTTKSGDCIIYKYIQSQGGNGWYHIVNDTDTDTWRPVKVNGTEKLGSGISTGALDLVDSSYISVTFDASTVKVGINDASVDNTTSGALTGSNKLVTANAVKSEVIYLRDTTDVSSGTGNGITVGLTGKVGNHGITVSVNSGSVAVNDASVVTGGTVYTAIETLKNTADTDSSSDKGIEVKLDGSVGDHSIKVTVTPGSIESGNTSVVTGGAVYDAIAAIDTADSSANGISVKLTGTVKDHGLSVSVTPGAIAYRDTSVVTGGIVYNALCWETFE